MGFLDKLKKTAQSALNTPAPPPPPAVEVEEEQDHDDHQHAAPPQQQRAAYDGPTFQYDGDVFPQPPGWDGLSVDDWFLKLETLRDRIMKADEEQLPAMTDDDGEPLDPEEVVLRLEGFTSGGHYEKFRNWGVGTWARRAGEDHTNYEFKMVSIAREKIMASRAGAMSGAGGALEAVEGISLETWAHINAALANGGGANFDTLLQNSGMDRPKWDRINAEWLARMTADTTFAIATVYGAAFAGSGQGQFASYAAHAQKVGVGGDLTDEPMPYERYVEIESAIACASDRGEDVNKYMAATFGINAVDIGHLGAFWTKKAMQDAMGYHKLYTELSAKYKAKYSV
jgi:hypothetical protein